MPGVAATHTIDMDTEDDRSAVAAEGEAADLFRANLTLIDRVAGRVCHQAGIRGADADDFASAVRVALIDNQYAILRAWQKKSSLATYLTVIVQRLLSDERNRTHGRWEPSAAARRGGSAAIVLETSVCRDGRPLEQVLPIVQAIDPSLSEADVRSLLATLPQRLPRPREVELDPAVSAEVRAPGSADDALLARETAQLSGRATGVVRRALGSLTAEERAIVRCRFGSGMSIADISRMFRLPQRPLYRQLESIIAHLRRELIASGIDSGSAESLIGSSVAALDFGLTTGKNDQAPESTEGGPAATGTAR